MAEKICVFFLILIGISTSYFMGYDSGYNKGCNKTWDSIIDFLCNYGKEKPEGEKDGK